ncbi:hypothetical protein E4U21_002922 [Claviceps maximensis]|nr:hypothetical protein E4U21_002922 [Claviceps maximensis]
MQSGPQASNHERETRTGNEPPKIDESLSQGVGDDVVSGQVIEAIDVSAISVQIPQADMASVHYSGLDNEVQAEVWLQISPAAVTGHDRSPCAALSDNMSSLCSLELLEWQQRMRRFNRPLKNNW